MTHTTSCDYPAGASRLHLLLRLWPEPYAGQVVRTWQVDVDGARVKPGVRNEHGNRTALWSAPARPGTVKVTATGAVETSDRAGVITGLIVRPNPAIYLRSTASTAADDAVRALVSPPGDDVLSWLHALMEVIHSAVTYQSGSTTVHSTAAEVLKAGRGVCQDHAHLFVAVARAHGVPARYVTGYMLADGVQDDLHETHAWAEAWTESLGWVAFDPSLNLCPTERYIRLTSGLDTFDAAPIRGLATGGLGSEVKADVRIARTAANGQGGANKGSMLRGQHQQ